MDEHFQSMFDFFSHALPGACMAAASIIKGSERGLGIAKPPRFRNPVRESPRFRNPAGLKRITKL